MAQKTGNFRSLIFEIINPLTYPGWDDLVLSSGKGSFFHSSQWARVLHEAYGYNPAYFIESEKNKISVLLPFMEVRSALTGRRGVSLPFTDFCEPLLSEGRWTDYLSAYVIEYGKKAGWKYLEMRGWPEALDYQASAYYFGHSLDLTRSEEVIFSLCRDSTKRNIKKALKEGVSVKVSTSKESMEHFCRMNFMTRKKHGLPPQPAQFFRKVYEHIIAKGLGIIVLASYRGDAVAGSVFFHFGGKAIYKCGASEYSYQHLRANNLVMWEAISWYRNNGYHSLSFGRTEPQNDGLHQFKAGWGAVEQMINYYRYDLRRDAFVRGEQKITGVHNKIFSRMPNPLLRLSGNLFYRHMG